MKDWSQSTTQEIEAEITRLNKSARRLNTIFISFMLVFGIALLGYAFLANAPYSVRVTAAVCGTIDIASATYSLRRLT